MNAFTRTSYSALLAMALAVAAVPLARADAIDELLERLKEKNIISEDEYKSLKDTREGERSVARQRRKEANEEHGKKEEVAKSGMQGWFRDGVVFESADKKNSLAVTGRIQLDYRNFSDTGAVTANTFDVRRAYVGVQGKFWDYYTFDVTGDFAGLSGSAATTNVCVGTGTTVSGCTTSVATGVGSSTHLDVGWLNAAWWKKAQLRFGQFKTPFSLEELTSSRFIDFQERSFVNAFVPAKERGIMVHGEPTTGLFYGVALTTGQGKNNNDTNNLIDRNDVIGRVAANIAQMTGSTNNVYHIGAAFSKGDVPAAAAPSLRTEGRGFQFFSTGSFGTKTERERKGLEAALAFGPVKLQTEYIDVGFSDAAGSTFDRDVKAYYLSANWLITGEKYADSYRGGAFGRIKPKNNFTVGGSGWGALELGLRYSNFDGSDFLAAGPGQINANNYSEAKSVTLGLKWMPHPNARFMLNYVKSDFEDIRAPAAAVTVNPDEEQAVTLRAQFDF